MSGGSPQQSVNPRGPQSSVPPWGGGQQLNGSAPMDMPHFPQNPTQPNIGGPNATGNPTQPSGPITPLGGPQTGPLTPPTGPITPVGQQGGGYNGRPINMPDLGTYGGGPQGGGYQAGGQGMPQGGYGGFGGGQFGPLTNLPNLSGLMGGMGGGLGK